MIERITDMPAGTVGLRASGRVTADDYREVLEPALKTAGEAGEIRLLYVLDDSFDMDLGAMLQDAKTGATVGLGHRSAWKRTAIVTDVEWVAKAVRAFTWMMPGELKVCGTSELEAARAWVAS